MNMNRGQKIVAVVLIPATLYICHSDFLWNAPKLIELSPGAEDAARFLAGAIAYTAAICTMLSRGSYFIRGCAFLIVLLSMSVSVLSGMATTSNASVSKNEALARRDQIKTYLAGDYSSAAIEKCEYQSRTCDSAAKGVQQRAYQLELASLPFVGDVGDESSAEAKAGNIVKLIALAALPLFSFLFSLILAQWKVMEAILGELPKDSKETGTDAGSITVNNGSKRSSARNDQEKTGTIDPKKKAHTEVSVDKQEQKKAPKLYIPSAKQIKKLEWAYKEMKKEGVKIGKKSLAKKAETNQAVASVWFDTYPKGDVILLEDKRGDK